MAFTESWVETDPDGAVHTVSVVDNHVRQMKAALRERMEGDPAVLGSGVFELGTFGTTAMVKKGVARAFTITNADQTTTYLQDGRLAINLDNNKLFHSRATGLVAVQVDLNAANLTGTIADARLSSNVPLKNAGNGFSGGVQSVQRPLAGDFAISTLVSGDSEHRFAITAGGGLEWGPGGGVVRDTNLYRSAANTLKTDDALDVVGQLTLTGGLSSNRAASGNLAAQIAVAGDANARLLVTAGGVLSWGDGNLIQDTNLYRTSADRLRTDDQFQAASLRVSAGSLADCAFQFDGDPNSGLYATAADTFHLVAGGAAIAQISSAGLTMQAGAVTALFNTGYKFTGQGASIEGSAVDDKIRFRSNAVYCVEYFSGNAMTIAVLTAIDAVLRPLLYDAADTAGTGFRRVRIAN